ncbi:MAG: hypothetical protein BalsKO_21930 [Balneolaceae bacterium]
MKHFQKISGLALLLISIIISQTINAQTVETLVSGPSSFDDGLAVDREGNIYASRYFGTTVTKISLEGTTSIFATGLTNPNGITFDDEGNLYITNAQGNRIDKVDPEGNRTTFVASVTNPSGLLVLESGSMLIAQYGQSRISIRNSEGDISTYLTGNGLNGPVGLQMDEEENLYIGNFNDGKIFKRTPEGIMIEIGDIPGWLGFITYANGYIYATGYQTHQIYRIKTDGSGQEVYAGTGSDGTADGELASATFNQPNGITASATGDTLYISDFGSRSLRMIIGVEGISTNNENEVNKPQSFRLEQNYPNPFNPSTIISFELAKATQVELSVFDVKGTKIVELTSSKYNSGSHSIRFDASNYSSGIYYYTLQAGSETQTRKMILIK